MTTEKVSQSQLAEELHCSTDTIRRYARDNGWTVIRPSHRKVLYLRDEVDAWLDKRTFARRA